MTDELQALLDRVTDDVLKKADTERENILAKAADEAAEIVRHAKADAAAIISNADKEAAILTQKGEEALRQASRDVLLSLRGKLEQRVSAAAETLMKNAVSGSSLAAVVSKMVAGFVESNGEKDSLELLLAPAEIDEVSRALQAVLADDLKNNVVLSPCNSVSGGFKLVFKESGVVYDFSDKALGETVSSFLGPKLAAIITEG